RDLEAVKAELELAHDRVMEALEALGVQAHVVRGPEPAELLALRGELTDQVGEVSVMRAATRLRSQYRHALSGRPVPVGVEAARPWVGADDARPVPRGRALPQR